MEAHNFFLQRQQVIDTAYIKRQYCPVYHLYDLGTRLLTSLC
jgi:hypothetical protein